MIMTNSPGARSGASTHAPSPSAGCSWRPGEDWCMRVNASKSVCLEIPTEKRTVDEGPDRHGPAQLGTRLGRRQTCHSRLAGKPVLSRNRPRTRGHSVIPAPLHHQNSVGTRCVQRVAQ